MIPALGAGVQFPAEPILCSYSSVVERLPCIITMKAKGLEFKSRWELLY